MKLKRVRLENVRSFLGAVEFLADGPVSILIGPNGGGKTNLLAAITLSIRQHLLVSWSTFAAATQEHPDRRDFRVNESLANYRLERHSLAPQRDQIVEVDLEVTGRDIANINSMKEQASELSSKTRGYTGYPILATTEWDISQISEGDVYTYQIKNNRLAGPPANTGPGIFKQYLNMYDPDAWVRAHLGYKLLSMPFLNLPGSRGNVGFSSSISLAGYDELENRKGVEAAHSRSPGQISNLAIGRIATRYRLLEHQFGAEEAQRVLQAEPHMRDLSTTLELLGYSWEIVTIRPLDNHYDIRLTKQGMTFLIGAASSGEKELLTFLFAIYALNLKDALIIIDEPELHLHPKWQTALLSPFEKLASETGNQFILATHSPVFVPPVSIQYVSRVYAEKQQSRIVRMNDANLPDPRHLFSIVNSQINERIFFADRVVLVEGISDRLLFEAMLRHLGTTSASAPVYEVIDVGGKSFFAAYEKVLTACKIPYWIIADLDYAFDIGSPEIKALFAVDAKKISEDLRNVGSFDGQKIVAKLEEAVETGDTSSLAEMLKYITARRRKLIKPRYSLSRAENKDGFTDASEFHSALNSIPR